MTDKPEASMSDRLNESLSALMDNEAEELELRRVLKELKAQARNAHEQAGSSDSSDHNEDLIDTWSRYHLVRDILKQQEPRQASPAILAGVRAALADEALPQAEADIDRVNDNVDSKSGKSWAGIRHSDKKRAGGITAKGIWSAVVQGGIAASVALVVLFTAHSLQQPEVAGDLTASNASSEYVEGEFNRVVSYQGQDENSGLDSQTRDRLSEAVYREIEQAPRVQYSIPVNFPEVPEQQ